MRRLWGWVLVGLLAMSWCALETPRLAQAAGTCGFRSNYFNGYYQNGKPQYQFTGASSYIVVRDGRNCSNPYADDFTNAWVMIAGPGLSDWGQVGFERTYGSTLRWFAQFSTADVLETWYSPFGVTSQIGTRHAFRVLYDPAARRLNANIDTTTVLRSGFDPRVEWGANNWTVQYFAETGHTATDVPGRSSTRTAYSAMGVQRRDTGGLMSTPCMLTGATDSSRWGRSASSCTAFTVWTK